MFTLSFLFFVLTFYIEYDLSRNDIDCLILALAVNVRTLAFEVLFAGWGMVSQETWSQHLQRRKKEVRWETSSRKTKPKMMVAGSK
jgi:CO dehydrogenase/acetyl-CoA synthase gamma subunit (corrinoid Fe-S protein)